MSELIKLSAADLGHRVEDGVQLAGEQVQLVVGHGQPGQPGEVRDLVSGDAGHSEVLLQA